MPALEATQGGMVVCDKGADIFIGTRDLNVCLGLVVVGSSKVGVAQVEDTLDMESVRKAVGGEVEQLFICKSKVSEQDVMFLQNQIERHVRQSFDESITTVLEVGDCCFINGKRPAEVLKQVPAGDVTVASPERQVCHYWMSIIQGSREDAGNYHLLNIDVQYDGTAEQPYRIQEEDVHESIKDGSFKDLALGALEQVYMQEGVEPEIAKEEWDIKLGEGALALLEKAL